MSNVFARVARSAEAATVVLMLSALPLAVLGFIAPHVA
jgi:hypothetical protein